MRGLKIQSDKKILVISFDKKSFDKNFLLKLLERINIEFLAKKAGFNDNVLELADKIKKQWWLQNNEKFLKKIKK